MKQLLSSLIIISFIGYSSISNSDEKIKPDTVPLNNSDTLAHYQPVLTPEFKSLLKNADIDAGKRYFLRKCSSCHDEFKSETHGKGPNLWNIMGRKAGTAPGFDYSDAMRQSGHLWNYATLNYYLTNTKKAVPGRIMNFKGIKKDKDRAKLLLFLRNMNDIPPPLPQ